MNGLRIVAGHAPDPSSLPPSGELRVLVNQPELRIEASHDVQEHVSPDGCRVNLVGHVLGRRAPDGSLHSAELATLAAGFGADESGVDSIEGRYLVAATAPNGRCSVWADKLGQRDLYYQQVGAATVFTTGLDLLPVAETGAELDQMALAHALIVYGYRPPKRHTFYSGVQRLGVEEGIRIEHGRATIVERPFAPGHAGAYAEPDLDRYADILIEAVRARASAEGNVVFLSSGWDSTALLACLVHLFGPSKVRAVTGRMVYADRSGVINQFEIDRARAMADFFGVPLSVVDFDYRHNATEQIERAKPLLRPQQMAGITALNHWILADHAASTGRPGEAVFAGEMSDGAHNLGFSQYATYFHPVIEFREYFDKMASYLHGPAFLSLLHNNQFSVDPIYQLMRGRSAGVYDDPAPSMAGRTRQLIASCLMRGVRVPLWSLRNNRLLTADGRARFEAEIERVYLDAAAKFATPATLYSWYLHLYNSLHWQGSTVATIPATVEASGQRCALPFHDEQLLRFLAGMPETWGRGLDLRPTKYPLKWMLANRVKYPMQLQTGPHSYLYDVDPSFSHAAEALYGSSMRPYFVDQLTRGILDAWLSPDVFDVAYVHGIVTQYIKGEEIRGSQMTDLWNLCVLTMTGLYGQ